MNGRHPPEPVDPFDLLGLPPSASASEVRAARRRLAKDHHPDLGGDAGRMRQVNAAVAAALAAIDARTAAPVSSSSPVPPRDTASPGPPPAHRGSDGRPFVRDQASFTIEALPAEAFEALVVVASWIGEVLVDDPPYLLEVHLREPADWWCRLELLPDAGSSTVSLTVAPVEVGPTPDVDAVRDVWVAELNRLDWSDLG